MYTICFISLPYLKMNHYDRYKIIQFIDRTYRCFPNRRSMFKVSGKLELRRRLRDAYAMLTHSVHSRTLRKGFTRAIA